MFKNRFNMDKKHKRSEEEIVNEFELPERKSKIAKNMEHDKKKKEDATTSTDLSGQCSADTEPNVGECSASLDRQQHEMNDETKSKIAFDQNPSPDIFKLHTIVCFELFEYLSLKDIHSMGQTCKRFNRIAGNYFQDNYSAARINLINGEIHCNGIPISGFSEYVKNIRIDMRNVEQLKYVEANCKSLEKIEFNETWSEIDDDRIECIKEILDKIEKITIVHHGLVGFHERIPKYCSNIKCIDIWLSFSIDASWLHQKYPTLEHLYFRGKIAAKTKDDWKVFFEKNPNIRCFRCEAKFLVANEDWLLTTNATLDCLSIIHGYVADTNRICSLVNRLYERGFYKKLRLHFSSTNQNEIDEMCKLPAIEELNSIHSNNDSLSVMTDVKELCSYLSDINVDSFIKCKFPNIERIELLTLKINQLFVLIGRLKKLKKLRLQYYKNDENQLLNLCALNKEREKLTEAGKVTIYVDEKTFSATKWAYNNQDFELIEIKRNDSWPYNFCD